MKTLHSSLVYIIVFSLLLIFLGSCDKSSNPVASGNTSNLTAQPESLAIKILEIAMSKISGGTKPYSIKQISDTLKIYAAITDSTLYVGGRSAGRAYVVVRDSPGTATVTVQVRVDTASNPPVPVALTFSPSTVTLKAGEQVYVSIMGGTPPYSVVSSPNPLVANSSISGGYLTVTGVGTGSTTVSVKDNATPAQTGILPITVTAGGCSLNLAGTWTGTFTFSAGTLSGQTFNASSSITQSGGVASGTFKDVSNNITWTLDSLTCSGTSFHATFKNTTAGALITNGTLSGNTISGTFSSAFGSGTFSLTRSGGGQTTGGSVSFTSNKGNFSASGNYDSIAFVTNVGAFNYYDYGYYNFLILALHVVSSTSYEYAVVYFSDSKPIAAGTFPDLSSPSKNCGLSYGPPRSTSDTSDSYYNVFNAAATISSLTSSAAQGTFSGKGNHNKNSSDSITVTSGTFNVTYVNRTPWSSSFSGLGPTEIKKIVNAVTKKRERY